MKKFSDTEGALLQVMQRSFPLVEKPFQAIGNTIGISEDYCMEIVNDLKDKKIIRNISGIFDPGKLGYATTLIAFSVPEQFISLAAEKINSYPGVSHNYLRDHRYNIWFTLAVDKTRDLEKLVSYLAQQSKAENYIIFPKEKQIKLGLILDINGQGDSYTQNSETASNQSNNPVTISQKQKEIISLLQVDLPITARPFQATLADSTTDVTENDLLQTAHQFTKTGVLRRYAAVLKHVNSGFIVNAMTAWQLNNNNNSSIFKVFQDEKAISHLYVRSSYPEQWEYPLFAMIHAHTDQELHDIIGKLENKSKLSKYIVLKSLQEFKKQRVTYFSNEFTTWHTEAGL